jgi:hypothetical protein
MGIDPTRTERVQRDPDPARPPLETVWHINDDGEYVAEAAHRGASYQLVDLTVHDTRTVLVFDSEMPIVSYGPDRTHRGDMFGTRKITVTVEGQFERIPL